MYDQEIVSFYDSEMVYQCDKIWPKEFEDYTDVSFLPKSFYWFGYISIRIQPPTHPATHSPDTPEK